MFRPLVVCRYLEGQQSGDCQHDTRWEERTNSDGSKTQVGYCIHCGMEWS